jgi:hypothetical protein
MSSMLVVGYSYHHLILILSLLLPPATAVVTRHELMRTTNEACLTLPVRLTIQYAHVVRPLRQPLPRLSAPAA